MKNPTIFLAAGLVLATSNALPDDRETPDPDATQGTLIFEDKFERDEPEPGKEAVGNGWTTNSAWRAKGKQQVDLDGGAMVVTRAPEADHGVAIFHDAAFQDGTVRLRFKLGAGDDLGIDFVDRDCPTVHAGHLCLAKVTLKRLVLQDSKTGVMDLKIRERRLAGEKSPELDELVKAKSRAFPLQLKAGEWHEIAVTVEGDALRASIDGKPVGEFRSEGIAHPTKKRITLAVNKQATIDDVSVRRLK